MMDVGPASGDSRYIPEVLLVGSLHGDEVVGYEVLLQLAYHLCENYKKDFIVSSVSIDRACFPRLVIINLENIPTL